MYGLHVGYGLGNYYNYYQQATNFSNIFLKTRGVSFSSFFNPYSFLMDMSHT